MKRRFVIPATIAFALHALLFMGSSRPPTVSTGTPKPPVVENTPEPKPEEEKRIYEVALEKLTKTEVVSTDDNPGGGSTIIELPPGLPDLPVPAGFVRDGAFEMTRVDVPTGGKGTMAGSWRPGGPGDGTGTEGVRTLAVSELDAAPRTRFTKAPTYPSAMRSTGMGGTVWVDFLVDERGRVSNVRVIKSTHVAFEAATVAAVSEWRFVPGTRNALPVRFRMSVPVSFTLSE